LVPRLQLALNREGDKGTLVVFSGSGALRLIEAPFAARLAAFQQSGLRR
jgi:hypothetical protein